MFHQEVEAALWKRRTTDFDVMQLRENLLPISQGRPRGSHPGDWNFLLNDERGEVLALGSDVCEVESRALYLQSPQLTPYQ